MSESAKPVPNWTSSAANAGIGRRKRPRNRFSTTRPTFSTPRRKRTASKPYTHVPDTKWQWEFENSFLYQETPDQLTAIAQVKEDMESGAPMDRLICGDVGFGKTEVAIRAAFKAVMSGRQVALLVPTTVLAHQHYQNFRERMSDYPVNIGLLSRYRTPSEQRKTITATVAGTVDIVIGTHRLISKDVTFSRLGLVVIDEEQRFGVKHKERFKELFRLVDVLYSPPPRFRGRFIFPSWA